MDDEEYLKRKYKIKLGKELHIENPKTMNEKLQWLKLYDRKPEYTKLVDKYLVRDYIRECLGRTVFNSAFRVWDDPDNIDFSKLPSKFVLKCNHNSGVGMCICKDKSQLDIRQVKSIKKRDGARIYWGNGHIKM